MTKPLIWDDEWGRSSDGDRRKARGSFEVNLGRPIVTNVDFVA